MSRREKRKLFRHGLITGFGWAVGVTIGFAIISTFLVLFLRSLGGLPFIGNWIASVVEVTEDALLKRTPLLPR